LRVRSHSSVGYRAPLYGPSPQRKANSGFGEVAEARAAIAKWIEWYNAERRHRARGYRSPQEFRGLQPKLVLILEEQYTKAMALWQHLKSIPVLSEVSQV
jgi:hypothetical protein